MKKLRKTKPARVRYVTPPKPTTPAMFSPLAKMLIISMFILPLGADAVDEDRLLRCIAQLETGTTQISKPVRKVGRAGERSAWQITPAVWQEYTAAPFARASTDAKLGRVVAAAHLRRLHVDLRRRTGYVNTFTLALAWNAGLSGAINGRVPPGARDYAARAVALYEAK